MLATQMPSLSIELALHILQLAGPQINVVLTCHEARRQLRGQQVITQVTDVNLDCLWDEASCIPAGSRHCRRRVQVALLRRAAERGLLHTLKAQHSFYRDDKELANVLLADAVRSDRLEVVQFLLGETSRDLSVPAAEHGALRVFLWACPPSRRMDRESLQNLLRTAASSDRLEVVQAVLRCRPLAQDIREAAKEAVRSGSLRCIRLFHSMGMVDRQDPGVIPAGLRLGDEGFARWAERQGYPHLPAEGDSIDELVLAARMPGTREEVFARLDWIAEASGVFRNGANGWKAVDDAAEADNLEAVRWFLDRPFWILAETLKAFPWARAKTQLYLMDHYALDDDLLADAVQYGCAVPVLDRIFLRIPDVVWDELLDEAWPRRGRRSPAAQQVIVDTITWAAERATPDRREAVRDLASRFLHPKTFDIAFPNADDRPSAAAVATRWLPRRVAAYRWILTEGRGRVRPIGADDTTHFLRDVLVRLNNRLEAEVLLQCALDAGWPLTLASILRTRCRHLTAVVALRYRDLEIAPEELIQISRDAVRGRWANLQPMAALFLHGSRMAAAEAHVPAAGLAWLHWAREAGVARRAAALEILRRGDEGVVGRQIVVNLEEDDVSMCTQLWREGVGVADVVRACVQGACIDVYLPEISSVWGNKRVTRALANLLTVPEFQDAAARALEDREVPDSLIDEVAMQRSDFALRWVLTRRAIGVHLAAVRHGEVALLPQHAPAADRLRWAREAVRADRSDVLQWIRSQGDDAVDWVGILPLCAGGKDACFRLIIDQVWSGGRLAEERYLAAASGFADADPATRGALLAVLQEFLRWTAGKDLAGISSAALHRAVEAANRDFLHWAARNRPLPPEQCMDLVRSGGILAWEYAVLHGDPQLKEAATRAAARAHSAEDDCLTPLDRLRPLDLRLVVAGARDGEALGWVALNPAFEPALAAGVAKAFLRVGLSRDLASRILVRSPCAASLLRSLYPDWVVWRAALLDRWDVVAEVRAGASPYMLAAIDGLGGRRPHPIAEHLGLEDLIMLHHRGDGLLQEWDIGPDAATPRPRLANELAKIAARAGGRTKMWCEACAIVEHPVPGLVVEAYRGGSRSVMDDLARRMYDLRPAVRAAALDGNLREVERIVGYGLGPCAEVSVWVAEGGHLHALKDLVDKGEHPLDLRAAYEAAGRGGHAHVQQWLLSQANQRRWLAEGTATARRTHADWLDYVETVASASGAGGSALRASSMAC